jgi:hypothetical protein
MWKFVKILALMVVSGVVTLYVTGLMVMLLLGKPQNGVDELNHAFLVWGAAVIGFLAPGFLVRYIGYERVLKIVWPLALTAASGLVALFVLGPFGLAIVVILVPGVIVWYRHQHGGRKGQSG